MQFNDNYTKYTHTHKRKKCSQERVGSVADNPDDQEDGKEAEGEARGTQG